MLQEAKIQPSFYLTKSYSYRSFVRTPHPMFIASLKPLGDYHTIGIWLGWCQLDPLPSFWNWFLQTFVSKIRSHSPCTSLQLWANFSCSGLGMFPYSQLLMEPPQKAHFTMLVSPKTVLNDGKLIAERLVFDTLMTPCFQLLITSIEIEFYRKYVYSSVCGWITQLIRQGKEIGYMVIILVSRAVHSLPCTDIGEGWWSLCLDGKQWNRICGSKRIQDFVTIQ